MSDNKNANQFEGQPANSNGNGKLATSGHSTGDHPSAKDGLVLPNYHRFVTEEKNPANSESRVANAQLEGLISQMLTSLGEDPARDGLKDTPQRVRRSLSFLTDGYNKNVQ